MRVLNYQLNPMLRWTECRGQKSTKSTALPDSGLVKLAPPCAPVLKYLQWRWQSALYTVQADYDESHKEMQASPCPFSLLAVLQSSLPAVLSCNCCFFVRRLLHASAFLHLSNIFSAYATEGPATYKDHSSHACKPPNRPGLLGYLLSQWQPVCRCQAQRSGGSAWT